MIKLQNLTPEVYYKHSRDFQFLGRLYDIVLNSIKTNTDTLYSLPNGDNLNTKLIDLLALTLGFKSKHNYNIKQLRAISGVFPLILKNKGNIQSVQLAGQALLSSEGITDPFNCELIENVLYVFIPSQLSDLNLFNDLLDYILPAGISCEIARGVQFETSIKTELSTDDSVTVTVQESSAGAYVGIDKDNEYAANDMTNATVYNEGLTYTNSDKPGEIIRTREETTTDDE